MNRFYFTPVLLVLLLVLSQRCVLGQSTERQDSAALKAAIKDYPSRKRPSSIPVEDLLAKPKIIDVKLSPDGTKIAYIARERDGFSVWLLDTLDLSRRKVLATRIIRAIYWSSDGTTLFAPTDGGIAFAKVATAERGLFYRFDAAAEEEFLRVDPSDDCRVLISRTLPSSTKAMYQIVRVDLEGNADTIYSAPEKPHDFLVDSKGSVRFVRQAANREHVLKDVKDDGGREIMRASGLDMFSLVSFDESEGLLYLVTFGQSDLRSLQALDLTTGQLREVHRDPFAKVDLTQIASDPATGKILLASYYGQRNRSYGTASATSLRESMQAEVSWLESQFDSSISIYPRLNGSWLIREQAAHVGHDRYFLFRPHQQQRRLTPVLAEERVEAWRVEDGELSEFFSVHYRASDGMKLSGYVMLPKGVPLETAPMVVDIHGGPFARARDKFGPSNYYANRGYVVFRPNFRSSKGFGLKFMKAGYGRFGSRVQHDIVEGLERLLALGVGDRDRVLPMGHSFGGYSVLALLTSYPERFVGGVATAPPINLLDTLYRIDHADINRYDGVRLIDVMPMLVADPDDSELIAQMQSDSPGNKIAALSKPLLIWAGARDQRVPISHVRDFALQAAHGGKSIKLVVDRSCGHNFAPSDEIGPQALLELTGEFLAQQFEREREARSVETQDYENRFHSLLLEE
ncbi:MAG: prolyl oligopeptidase family serine peptidase [Pirellulaceae bacterium]